MKEISKSSFDKLLNDKDEDIKKIASNLLELMFEYCSILSEGLALDFCNSSIDRDTIQRYDSHRRNVHDSIITKINILNRVCIMNNDELLLNTDGMERGDIGDAVVLYCNIPIINNSVADRILRGN